MKDTNKVFILHPTMGKDIEQVKLEHEQLFNGCKDVLAGEVEDVKPIGEEIETNPLLVLGANLQAMAQATLVVVPDSLGYGSDEVQTLTRLAEQYGKPRLMLHTEIDF